MSVVAYERVASSSDSRASYRHQSQGQILTPDERDGDIVRGASASETAARCLRPLKRESGSWATGESEMKKCPKGETGRRYCAGARQKGTANRNRLNFEGLETAVHAEAALRLFL
ncbi:unnamed protein product, partial [Iphiclides podalirius]